MKQSFVPHQRAILESMSPPADEARFSLDASPRARFCEAKKFGQRERGSGLFSLVLAAFSNGAAAVFVLAGDYRFATGGEYGCQRRDDSGLARHS